MQLRPHQWTAVDFLASRGFACLWDDVGVGKTAPTAVAAAGLRSQYVLVFCPSAVRQHWARSFQQWAPNIPVTVEEGYVKTIGQGATIMSHANLSAPDPCAVIRNTAIRNGHPYDIVIIDEADGYRQYSAARTRNLFPMGPGDSIWAWTKRVWCLTGTPIVNSAGDLYPIFAGPLGMASRLSWFDFCTQFADMQSDMNGPKAVGLKNAAILADWLRPHVLRRTAESIGLNLPPLTGERVRLDLPEGALAHAMAGLEGWTPQRLIQALEQQDDIRDGDISRVRHALGVAKVSAVARDLQSMLQAGKGPLVCFFQHTAVRDGLKELLKAYRIGVIDGKTSRAKIELAETSLQQKNLDILLVQTQAGGAGLTLTASNQCQVAELPWTATAVRQAIARIHRMTQERACHAKVYQANGCWLEDVLMQVVDRKQRASAELLNLLTTSV